MSGVPGTTHTYKVDGPNEMIAFDDTSPRHARASIAHLRDASGVAQWMVPDGMHSKVHTFDAREGSSFRSALTVPHCKAR